MSNAKYAAMLERENPELYYEIRGWVQAIPMIGQEPLGSYEVGQKVLTETGDERLANLAECTAAWWVTGR